MQSLFVAWETGQIPNGDCYYSMDEETISDLYDMIAIWKRTERENNLFRLSMMICGDPDKSESNGARK